MKQNGSRRHLIGIIKSLEARNAGSDAMLCAAALAHGGRFLIPNDAMASIGDHTEYAVTREAGGIVVTARNPKLAELADELTMQVLEEAPV